MSKCLSGQGGGDNVAEDAQPKGVADKSKTGANNPAQSVINGAKKLKGLFGF